MFSLTIIKKKYLLSKKVGSQGPPGPPVAVTHVLDSK